MLVVWGPKSGGVRSGSFSAATLEPVVPLERAQTLPAPEVPRGAATVEPEGRRLTLGLVGKSARRSVASIDHALLVTNPLTKQSAREFASSSTVWYASREGTAVR